MFKQFYAYICAQIEDWKKIFIGIRNSILTTRYLQIPCMINSQPAIGQFEYFSYPSSIQINIIGWKPLIWNEGTFTYVSGLPSKPKKDITIECISETGRTSSRTVKANTIPDWESIFDTLTLEPYSLD